jgi:cytochrome P450
MPDYSNASLFQPEIQEKPFPYYEWLMERAPVYQMPDTGFFIVSRYDLVLRALKQPTVFSSKLGFAANREMPPEAREIYEKEGFGEQVPTLVSNDPPDHSRYRKLVNKAFTAARVRKMHAYIQAIADDLVDAAVAKGTGELEVVSEFSVPLPMMVIADQLGVPRADMDRFKEWSDTAVEPLGLMITKERQIYCAKRQVEFQHYFVEKLEECRVDPKDDILSDLVQAEVEGERPLDTRELLSIIGQLLVAGNETTTNALSTGVCWLINNPDQADLCREDDSRYENLAEEILRVDSPVQGLFRMTTEDTELGGVEIPKGSIVNLRYGAANRDPARFDDPGRFDALRRNASAHLAFGGGIHHCIGAQLARREIQCGMRSILTKLDNLRFSEGKNTFQHHPSFILRGLKELYVRFDTRSP